MPDATCGPLLPASAPASIIPIARNTENAPR